MGEEKTPGRVVVVEGGAPAEAVGEAGVKAGERVRLVSGGRKHDADAMREALAFGAGAMPPEDAAEEQFRAAATLMANGRFDEAIAAFTTLARGVPGKRGRCENNIGACQFFLGRYRDAIKHYRRAGEAGFDPGMVADNIKEAEEALASGEA